MSRTLNILLIGIGLMVAFFPVMTELTTNSGNTIMMAVGIALIGIGIFSDHKQASQKNQQKKLAASSRIAELTRQPWNSHQTLDACEPFNGAPRMALTAMLALPGIAAAGYSVIPLWFLATSLATANTSIDWGSIFYLASLCLGSSAIAALLLFFAARNKAYIGKPTLILSTRGFTHPIHGGIDWKHVTGIFLQESTHRGHAFFILHIRLDDYHIATGSAHSTERWLGLLRLGNHHNNIIRLPIDGLSEKPEVIGATAQFLWKQATGNDYPWNPRCSDEINAASRRIHEHLKSSKDKQFMQEKLETNPEYLLNAIKQVNADAAFISSEAKKRRNKAYWQVAAVLILYFTLPIAWVFISAWLKGQ